MGELEEQIEDQNLGTQQGKLEFFRKSTRQLDMPSTIGGPLNPTNREIKLYQIRKVNKTEPSNLKVRDNQNKRHKLKMTLGIKMPLKT